MYLSLWYIIYVYLYKSKRQRRSRVLEGYALWCAYLQVTETTSRVAKFRIFKNWCCGDPPTFLFNWASHTSCKMASHEVRRKSSGGKKAGSFRSNMLRWASPQSRARFLYWRTAGKFWSYSSFPEVTFRRYKCFLSSANALSPVQI